MIGKKTPAVHPEDYFQSPEMQLLLAGCRRVIGNLDAESIPELLERPFQGPLFLELCNHHCLTLLVFKTLIKPFREYFSVELAEQFELESRRLTLKHVQLSRLLVDIHHEFEQNHIRHVFLKGPVLNRQLFGDELLRYSKDLDLLVELPDMMKASDCLQSFGFSPKPPFQRRHFWLHKMCNKDITYLNRSIGGVIDLHWKTDLIETALTSERLDENALLANVPFQGERMPVLSGLQNCLFLCHHGARHHWFRLRWLLDIPLLMKKENIDAQTLLLAAEKHGIRRSVEEVFFLAGKLFHLDSRHESFSVESAKSKRIAERMERSFQAEGVWKSSALTTHYRILLYAGIRNKLRLWLVLFLQLFMKRILKW